MEDAAALWPGSTALPCQAGSLSQLNRAPVWTHGTAPAHGALPGAAGPPTTNAQMSQAGSFSHLYRKKPWSFRSDVTADWAVLGIHILFTARFPELRAVGMGLSLAELWEQERPVESGAVLSSC